MSGCCGCPHAGLPVTATSAAAVALRLHSAAWGAGMARWRGCEPRCPAASDAHRLVVWYARCLLSRACQAACRAAQQVGRQLTAVPTCRHCSSPRAASAARSARRSDSVAPVKHMHGLLRHQIWTRSAPKCYDVNHMGYHGCQPSKVQRSLRALRVESSVMRSCCCSSIQPCPVASSSSCRARSQNAMCTQCIGGTSSHKHDHCKCARVSLCRMAGLINFRHMRTTSASLNAKAASMPAMRTAKSAGSLLVPLLPAA